MYEVVIEAGACVIQSGVLEHQADPSAWTGDLDAIGYPELEFRTVSGLAFTEIDETVEVGPSGRVEVAGRYAVLIEEVL